MIYDTVLDWEIVIDGYNLLRSDRNSHGGGILCYIRKDVVFNKRENLSIDFENIFFDIFLPKSKPILVGVFYRPPNQPNFLENLSKAISNSENFDNQEVYMLCDLNFNLLFEGRRIPNEIKTYREFCALHGLKQLISKPTRMKKFHNLVSLILDSQITI